jgi:hypothetical protein
LPDTEFAGHAELGGAPCETAPRAMDWCCFGFVTPPPRGGVVTKELLLKQLAPEFRNKEFGAFNFKDPGDDSLATSGGGHSFRILIRSHRHTEGELMSVMTLTSVS